MTIDKNIFAFTSWLMRNIHVETETGLTEFDGYEWYNYMWNKWLQNTDVGRKIINDALRKNMNDGNNNNPGTTDNMTTNSITGQNNMGKYPEPGQTWQHYKGGRYEIIAMCNHTTTNEPLVIYKSLSFNGFHARPYSEWHDEIWIDGYRKRRFELI